MRGEPRLRRAGMVSAGTLALVLTSAASPANNGDDQKCKEGEGLLTGVSGAVCDTTDSVTGTAARTLDGATGGRTRDLTDSVKKTTDGVTGAVHDTTQQVEGGDGDGGSPGSSTPSGQGGSGDRARDERSGSDGDRRDGSRRTTIGAAGFPAGARGEATAAGAGVSPALQPLSPLAGLHMGSGLDSSAVAPGPKLPKIAPSPMPSPKPTPPGEPEATQYAAPAGDEQPFDRGEATPALMVLFALIAAGVVTGGHVAVAQARIRSRRVS